jgi:phage FluMu protein Com
MDKINKDFDGVSWEWKGKTAIRDLKPICPKCKYELDIQMIGRGIPSDLSHITFPLFYLGYLCPKCSFSVNTNIDGVNDPKDLRKAVRKKFEHRQRLMVRKTSKNNK